MRASALLALVLTACAGAAPSVESATPHDPGPDEWSTMGFEDRHRRMTFTVHPTLARRFQRFAETEYPELACVTCHGMDGEAVDYEMPRGLPPLDPAALPDADTSPTARFMVEVVLPETDRLMRAGGTTTCFSCHPSAEGDS